MADDLYRDSGLTVDFRACRVWVDDDEIRTSAIRFRMLTQLIKNAGRPLNAQEIMLHAWEGADYDQGLVRWHIAKLRKELGDNPPKRIVHVRGFGYRYDVPMPVPSPEPQPEKALFRRLAGKPSLRCDSSGSRPSRIQATSRALRCMR
ncbi:MAG: winged helix-turn-helix domain-containing protein [Chloroflexi bacterium]|nr:winged helix-turn-helix domain-containing protein [Chloroflexota bacterium]MDA1226748.1 winged helix-turn-helix domain-containing protein [Chloroflexota bacterium]